MPQGENGWFSDWAMVFFVLALLLAIAVIVLFIISCVSTTPFNMDSRSEGLLVCTVLALLTIWMMSSSNYSYQRQKDNKKLLGAGGLLGPITPPVLGGGV